MLIYVQTNIHIYICIYKDMVSIGYVTFSFFKPFEIHLSVVQVFRPPEMPETAVRSPWKHVDIATREPLVLAGWPYEGLKKTMVHWAGWNFPCFRSVMQTLEVCIFELFGSDKAGVVEFFVSSFLNTSGSSNHLTNHHAGSCFSSSWFSS